MRRFLLPRKPIGARRTVASFRPPVPRRQKRSPRPLALIFRAPRMAPAPMVKGADGRTIAIAPRLQIVLNLSNNLSIDHWHLAAVFGSFGGSAPAPASTAILRSSRLHVHRAGERPRPETNIRPEVRAQRELPAFRARSQLPRLAHSHFSQWRIPRLAALLRRDPDAAADRSGARSAPALEHPSSPLRRLDWAPPASASLGARSSAGPLDRRAAAATSAAPAGRLRLRLRPLEAAAAVAAPTAELPAARLPSARAIAAFALSPPIRFRSAEPGSRQEPGRASTVLHLAGLTAARARPESRVQPSSERRSPSPPSLDYRRPALSAAAAAAEPTPRAAPAPPPQPPAIDVDALSRDVISRIEKRLRIERERHGRV
jgi:hypothetical protein